MTNPRTEAGFTPGPWHATNGGPRSGQWTVWADGGDMGDQRVAVMPYELIAQCGNAHLIAAAPELYEELDELWRSIMGEPVGGGDGQTFTVGTPSAANLNKANAALRKARGQP